MTLAYSLLAALLAPTLAQLALGDVGTFDTKVLEITGGFLLFLIEMD